MNVFKKAIVVLAMLTAAVSTQAIEVNFDFSVYSSGASIYPCNAGIKHDQPTGEVCYMRTNPVVACDPNACAVPSDCDCVCAGSVGREQVDFLKVSYANWTDHNEALGSATDTTVTSSTNGNSLFNSTEAFTKQLTELSFHLGSELFGAEYFLDVCFRGPQIDYASAGINTGWTATSEATIQDLLGYQSYKDVAGLVVNSEVVCEYQVANSPLAVDALPTSFPAEGNSMVTSLIDNQGLNGTTDAVSESASVTGTDGLGKAPTFCKVRYTFSEGTGLTGRNLFRPWKKQAARICTKTSIEEP